MIDHKGVKQAMVFAAGLGTRLKPLTDTMPKALVRVGGEPLLKRVVLNLKTAGFERIIVNVHHFAQQIIDYLEENQYFGVDIRISDEREGLLETGGGIKKALPLFDANSPILIHNVDIHLLVEQINVNYSIGKQRRQYSAFFCRFFGFTDPGADRRRPPWGCRCSARSPGNRGSDTGSGPSAGRTACPAAFPGSRRRGRRR